MRSWGGDTFFTQKAVMQLGSSIGIILLTPLGKTYKLCNTFTVNSF